MRERTAYLKEIIRLDLPTVDTAVALLFFYRQTQEYEERSAKELATDLHDEGLAKQNISRLAAALTKSQFTTKGKRKDTFQINAKYLDTLERKYGEYLNPIAPVPADSVIPNGWVQGTRRYLERLVSEINLSYDNQIYDGVAVLCRRLMESLIIELYILQKRQHEIQDPAGHFFGLEKLIQFTTSDRHIAWGKNTKKWMLELKQMGDVAAHDRTYITEKSDIDDNKMNIRRVISELLEKTNLKK